MAWQDRWTTEEFHQEVKRLRFEVGLSCVETARVLGADVTKNMIVRASQTILGRSRSIVTFPDSVWPSEPRLKRDEKVNAEPESPTHLIKVKDGQCRAPLWPDFLHSQQRVDPSEHMLCGKKCRDGSSWCEEHHVLFFPPELQKRPTKKRSSGVRDNSAQFQ